MITVVSGAPCSGKSTYCREHVSGDGIVFDYDTLAQAITYKAPHEELGDVQRACLYQIRSRIIQIATEYDTDFWFIATTPSKELLEALGNPQVVEIEATYDECIEHLMNDNLRTDKEKEKAKIDKYFGKEARMTMKNDREYRAAALLLPIQERKDGEPAFIVEGYATTFETPYELFDDGEKKYYEAISRNALDGADMSDVIMQYDHSGKVFARQSNGTLQIIPDERGLKIRADLSKSQAARDLYEEISNGLITKMSWAFTVNSDDYDRKTLTRTITGIRKVYDVSAVSRPANEDTSIMSARSYVNGVIDVEARREAEAEEKRKKLRILLEVNNDF